MSLAGNLRKLMAFFHRDFAIARGYRGALVLETFEALFGVAHGFDSNFPASSGTTDSANSLSMQFGGGINIALTGNFGLRAIQVDYVRTSFRNFANDTQHDVRLAAGITYHFGKH